MTVAELWLKLCRHRPDAEVFLRISEEEYPVVDLDRAGAAVVLEIGVGVEDILTEGSEEE